MRKYQTNGLEMGANTDAHSIAITLTRIADALEDIKIDTAFQHTAVEQIQMNGVGQNITSCKHNFQIADAPGTIAGIKVKCIKCGVIKL